MVRVILSCPWKISSKTQIFNMTPSGYLRDKHYSYFASFALILSSPFQDCTWKYSSFYVKSSHLRVLLSFPDLGTRAVPCLKQASVIPTAGSHRSESKPAGLEMQLQPGQYLDTPWSTFLAMPDTICWSTDKPSCTISALRAELRVTKGPQHHKCLV